LKRGGGDSRGEGAEQFMGKAENLPGKKGVVSPLKKPNTVLSRFKKKKKISLEKNRCAMGGKNRGGKN